MPGSSTTPGRLDARFHAPTRVAFRIRNGVGTRDKNLCEAQWLACVLLYRRFAAALTGVCARLEADVVSYSFIVSDLHRLLVAGLPAHCERLWTLPTDVMKKDASVSGFNIGTNSGDTAGQTIGHAHVHLIPRRQGDVQDPRGGVRGVIPGKAIY